MNPGEQIHKSMQRICDDDLAKQAKEQPPDGGNRKGVGKVKMNLVMHDMAEALYEVARVMTFGAVKHEPKGWIKVPNGIYEYTEALHRHLNAESRGELRDKEWDLLHAAHAACCALIRTQLILNELKAKQELPEGTTFENGFAMVPGQSLRFKITPEGCPPDTTITIKRPIGGSPEQAGPLSDFTPMNPDPSVDTGIRPVQGSLPLPGTYMTLSGEVTPWERLMRDGSCRIKRYKAEHCYTRGNEIVLTCVDRGVDGKQYALVSLTVDWTELRVRDRVEDPISFFSSLVGNTLSDRDFAIFTGRRKQNEEGGEK